MTGKVYTVSTSDRVTFKRCRRKWDFGSRNRQSLALTTGEVVTPLWLGTGFHFALEDHYGYNLFGNPMDSWRAYVDSHRRSELPDDHKEAGELAVGMLTYFYEDWLPQHGEPFPTLWIDGVPQVEVNVRIPLDIPPPPGYISVEYSTTFDRLALDPLGRVVVVDYKTAARAYEAGRLELDPQVSSYFWAARLIYGDQVEGAVWHIFLKAVPDAPEVLKNGELSKNKQQHTTAAIYRKTLMEYFGKVPPGYADILNHFAAQENEYGDKFITRESIYRNLTFGENEERKIFSEIHDMIDPGLSLYPNPTRDCSWDCNYKAPCLSMDDGSDFEYMLETEYEKWEGEGYKSNNWRDRLKYPETLEVVYDAETIPTTQE